jgi:ABC-type phosphate/phosphonate transport system substrate-binding protein
MKSNKSMAAFDGRQADCCRAFIVVVLLMLLAVPPRTASGIEKIPISVAFSKSTFLDVNKDQAQTVAALWTELVAGKWGRISSTRICTTLAELDKGISSKKIDLVVLLPAEYLQLREKESLAPLYISAKDKDLSEQFILVVRKDSGARSLADLKGKKLLQQAELSADGRSLWLDTLLMRQGVQNPKRFFANAREATKASASIFEVFFKRADCCVVTHRSLRVMAELNPQLSRELLVLEESPPWPISIIAVRKGLPIQLRDTIQEALGTLDKSAQGKQLLTLFRMDRLVSFQTTYLTQLEKLFRENRHLKLQLQE